MVKLWVAYLIFTLNGQAIDQPIEIGYAVSERECNFGLMEVLQEVDTEYYPIDAWCTSRTISPEKLEEIGL